MKQPSPAGAASQPASSPLFELRAISRHYPTPEGLFAAVDEVTATIRRGETIALMGRSGSGKTTLLNLLAGLDHPTGGELTFEGKPLHALDEDARAAWRAGSVGVVFQFFQLLPTLTACENVMLPMDFIDGPRAAAADRRAKALELLERTGVADQADKFPGALSGGQQQRVAIARALANDPAVLVADEPTGNLDSHTAAQILDLFARLGQSGTTLIVATHEPELAQDADRTWSIEDGRLHEGAP